MRLKAEGVSFGYSKDKMILRNVNFEITSGEVIGIRAPSGYGKSTLAKILAGYLSPIDGQVTLDDKVIPKLGYHPVQLMFQHPEKAIHPKWQMKKVLEESGAIDYALLEELGIETSWLHRLPHELSGGELQRFCIARILNAKTRFVIADEMTAMLDALTQVQIWHKTLSFAQQNRLGVVVISHDNHLMHRICDKIVDLNQVNF